MKTYTIPIFTCRMVKSGEQEYAAKSANYPEQAQRVIHEYLKDSPCERVVAVYLNGRNDILGIEQIAQGGLHGAALTPKDVLRGAIACNASGIILGHNHPSGDSSPSAEDLHLTNEAKRACEIVGIGLLDHLVVTAGGDFTSIAQYEGWC